MMSCVWVAVAIALAGCDTIYGLSGRGEDAGPSSSDSMMPVADGGVIDTPPGVCEPAANPTGDDDNDDILNQNDRCPQLSDRGYNEDGDCDGDACDVCPQDDVIAADSDGDGVGDPCDLPGITADIARMDGFGDVDEIHAPLAPGWVHDSVAGTLSSSATNLYAYANTLTSTPFLIETQFRVAPAAVGWTVGILFGANAMGDQTPDGWMLAVNRVSPALSQIRVFLLANGVPTSQNMDQPVTLGAVVRLRLRVESSTLFVTLDTDGTRTYAQLQIPTAVAADKPFGIGVIGTQTITFDYLYEVHHTD